MPFIGRAAQESGRVVLIDRDHTEMTYAAAEVLENQCYDACWFETHEQQMALEQVLLELGDSAKSLGEQLQRGATRVLTQMNGIWEEATRAAGNLTTNPYLRTIQR